MVIPAGTFNIRCGMSTKKLLPHTNLPFFSLWYWIRFYQRISPISMTPEHQRLALLAGNVNPLAQWGPYLSERQWGTVREDYSHDGNAWQYFPFDQAHCRA